MFLLPVDGLLSSLSAVLRRLYHAIVVFLITFLSNMSETEVLLSRSASAVPIRAPCCERSLLSREDSDPQTSRKDVCTMAVAQHLLRIEEHLKTRPVSTGIAAGLYSFSTPVPDFCQLVALECHVKSDVLRRHLAEVVEKLRRKQQVTDAVRARARQVFDPDSPENHRRLEQIWALFLDYKPLPPSFQHCSSFTNTSTCSLGGQRPATTSPCPSSTSTCRAHPAPSRSCSTLAATSCSPLLPSQDSQDLCFLSECREEPREGGQGEEEESRDVPRRDWAASSGTADTPQLLTQSSSWGELGFQHPLRDFRGAGCLAADCLLFLGGRFPSHARRLLHQSHEETFWMPFAVTSINVVDWLLHMMNCRLLDVFFLACGDDGFWDRVGVSLSEQRSSPELFASASPAFLRPQTADRSSDADSSRPDRLSARSSISMVPPAEEKESHASHGERQGRRGDVDCRELPPREPEAVPQVFFFLFVAVLSHFCRFWRSRKPENIMQFGKVSADFRKRLEAVLRELSFKGDWLSSPWQLLRGPYLTEDVTESCSLDTEAYQDIMAWITWERQPEEGEGTERGQGGNCEGDRQSDCLDHRWRTSSFLHLVRSVLR